MNIDGLTLLIPDKTDPERDLVAQAWTSSGGTVTRIGRFWDPPPMDRESVRLYGNDTFALVLAQKLGLRLIGPDDDLLIHLPAGLLGRRIRITELADASDFIFPTFVKPFIPKQFRAGIYTSCTQLMAECAGLGEDSQIYESEVVRFQAEARGFILNGRLQDLALYEGHAALAEAADFLSGAASLPQLPSTVVLDVGLIENRGWAIIEANACWGAGLNGCRAEKVIGCIADATRIAC